MGDDDDGHLIGDRAADHDDAVLEQARVDVIGALAAAGLFDDDGDEIVVFHMGQLSVVSCPLQELQLTTDNGQLTMDNHGLHNIPASVPPGWNVPFFS